MIDIHSHIDLKHGTDPLEQLLADMDKFHIEKRVISNMRIDDIRKGIQDIVTAVKDHPDRLIGCAVLNPSLSTILEDTKYACGLSQIRMIEFNSYEHGYAPDDCEVLNEVFSIIKERKLPVKVFSGIGAKALPHQWEHYVRAYPEIPFIFLHMGCFDYGYSCVDIVNRNDNAWIETSNQYEMQILKKAFQQLSTEKVLFGSCYPERFTRNAIEIFDLFSLKDEVLHAYLHSNAEALLNRENSYGCN